MNINIEKSFSKSPLKPMLLFEQAGMVLSGINPDAGLVEIIELNKHPFFIGVQFHPEYKSTVEKPHPLFVAFVKASMA